jgi:hypothetical protein
MTADPRDRLLDLLAAEATQGLTEDETRELRGLLRMFPDEDPDSIARAAAAADMAFSDPLEPMPPELVYQIERQAAAFFANRPEPAPPPPPPRTPRSTYLALALATGLAAALLWALVLRKAPQAPAPTPQKQDLAAEFDKLRGEPGTQGFKGEKAGASGELVWNNAKQEGYVKVTGLPALDPTKEQYQLWIVDAARTDPEHQQPVSGGVFDVQADGTTLIPVKSGLKIGDAKLFAVTKEKAGGVVVTKKTVPEMSLVLTKPG